MPTFAPEDVAHAITALHDLLTGYPPEELADGWREAVDRLADTLGRDDPQDWPQLA